MQNVFDRPEFNMAALTAAINRLPNRYGRVSELGLFTPKGVTTTSIQVEEKAGTLKLLPTVPREAPAPQKTQSKRKLRSFAIPTIKVEDAVLPNDAQNVRAFGSENAMMAILEIVTDKLQDIRDTFDQTIEYMRVHALKGVLKDGAGTTLYNFYTEFEIQQKSVNFALTTSGTEVLEKCMEVTRHIEQNLRGERMTGVHALVGQTFFDKLVTHPKVKEAYTYFQRNQPLGGDYRKGFQFGGIIFEEYLGTVTLAGGSSEKLVGDDDAVIFPLGTATTFQNVYAPGNFIETVNTIGLPMYVKQERRKFDQGIDLYAESNPLPICMRPELLVAGSKA